MCCRLRARWEDRDPNQAGQQQGSQGPTGDKDDPMHVKVTGQPAAPQNATTSALSTLPGLAQMV